MADVMEETKEIKEWKLYGLNNMYAGKLFGKLTIISVLGIRKKRTIVKALCECGTVKEILLYNIRRGHTKSCGCMSKNGLTPGNLRHGDAYVGGRCPEYAAWMRMKISVLSKSENIRLKHKAYDIAGISICERWVDKKIGYQNFLEDMGRKPSKNHRLARINKLEGFNGENCAWVVGGSMNGKEVV